MYISYVNKQYNYFLKKKLCHTFQPVAAGRQPETLAKRVPGCNLVAAFYTLLFTALSTQPEAKLYPPTGALHKYKPVQISIEHLECHLLHLRSPSCK